MWHRHMCTVGHQQVHIHRGRPDPCGLCHSILPIARKRREHLIMSDWKGGLTGWSDQIHWDACSTLPKAPYAGFFFNPGKVLKAVPYAGFSSNAGPVLIAALYSWFSRGSTSSCRDLDLSLKQTTVRVATIRMRIMRSIKPPVTPMMLVARFSDSSPGESGGMATEGDGVGSGGEER